MPLTLEVACSRVVPSFPSRVDHKAIARRYEMPFAVWRVLVGAARRLSALRADGQVTLRDHLSYEHLLTRSLARP
jgi:hypothetical protein